MAGQDWSQRDLEALFVRKDNQELVDENFDRRLTKIENALEWFQRLIIGQGVILVVALILFVVERFGAG